jgi:hypothetical protein
MGDQVHGQIVKGFVVVTDPALMAERFANLPRTPASVLKFTQKYGPLRSVPVVKGTFSFELKQWYEWHRLFQNVWEITSPQNLPDPGTIGMASYERVAKGVNLGEHSNLSFGPDGAELLVKDMWTLLNVCVSTIPLERLRICKAPNCTKPYFIAHHLKQTLCNSKLCKKWNQLRLKREWFEREKEPILAERKRRRKEDKDVTQKAR